MTTDILKAQFDAFQPYDAMEAASLFLFQYLLKQEPQCLYRDAFDLGHFSASAWIVNPTYDKVLLMFHKAYQEWYQFGGHMDGEADALAVAIREVEEESGLRPTQLHIPEQGIFDVDAHLIKERVRKGVFEPAHMHMDIRYLMVTDDTQPLPTSPEGIEMRWMGLAEAQSIFPLGQGRWRMAEKTKARALARAA